MNMSESDYEVLIKRVARIVGMLILVISMYLSYDGFDQGVTGGNSQYSSLAKTIGIVFCVAISAIQFVLNSRYDQLNLTLKAIGFASYAYSIYTNYLGATHIMMMETWLALSVAFAMDVVPEPLIAWSFDDATKGDLLGNAAKWIFGVGGKKSTNTPAQNPTLRQSLGLSQSQPQNQPKHGFKPKFNPNQADQTRPRSDGVRPEFQNKIKHR